MTIASAVQKVIYAGNDVATSFSFAFTIHDSENLVVVVTDSDGVETTLTEGAGASNYSVTVAVYPGAGSITYPASGATVLATGESITINRVMDLLQATDLENQGGYFPEVQETVYDKLTMIDQQQQEQMDRSLKLPLSYDGAVSPTFSNAPVAAYYARVNSGGTALEFAAIATTDGSASDVTPVAVSQTAGNAGAGADFARHDHVHKTSTQSVLNGGTGATTEAGARTALGSTAVGDALFTAASTIAAKNLTTVNGADIASATTTNLTTATGDMVDVTGTTTITAITLADGDERRVRFTGALILTHGASLILPGSANITTAAGDVAVFRGYATSVVRCVAYHKFSGLAVVAPTTGTITKGSLLTKNPVVLGSNTSAAHGLGAKPGWVVVELECLTTDLGYSVGETVVYASQVNNENGGVGGGMQVSYPDASNIELRFASSQVVLAHKTTFVMTAITVGNWKAIVTPYRLN